MADTESQDVEGSTANVPTPFLPSSGSGQTASVTLPDSTTTTKEYNELTNEVVSDTVSSGVGGYFSVGTYKVQIVEIHICLNNNFIRVDRTTKDRITEDRTTEDQTIYNISRFHTITQVKVKLWLHILKDFLLVALSLIDLFEVRSERNDKHYWLY